MPRIFVTPFIRERIQDAARNARNDGLTFDEFVILLREAWSHQLREEARRLETDYPVGAV